MQKEYTYSIASISCMILGIITLFFSLFTKLIPNSSRGALCLFSICFITIGTVSYAVHHKKYIEINNLKTGKTPALAHWIYKVQSSPAIHDLLLEEKHNSLITSTLIFILGFLFSCYFFSASLYFIGISVMLFFSACFLVTILFICTYYNKLAVSNSDVIFSSNSIYFLDDIYYLVKAIYVLEDIRIVSGSEPILQFLYSQYDVENTPSFSISLPIPEGKLEAAKNLRKYYLDTLRDTTSF